MTKAMHLILSGLFIISFQSKGNIDDVPHRPKAHVHIVDGTTSAYPNPFDENTTIFYSAKEDAFVKVKLYTHQGKLMGQLFDDLVEKGATYQFELDGRKMLPGVYYYTIETDKKIIHQRIELIR
ncbi:MAG: T9SS type A sorting domain-containing protein [Bacteroidetes bacterium]|nr:T9SS type A sorting domain-containing protein [Bacteroidota bacterium]